MPHKKSYFVTISTLMTATGKFSKDINVPFLPTHVIVHTASYDGVKAYFEIRSHFVQGGVVSIGSENLTFTPKTKIQCVEAVRGSIDFECVDSAGALKTNMNATSLGMMLEFIIE